MAADETHVADSCDAGDGDDFDAWVSARVPALLRFAYLMTGSQEAAEESLQTALTKACEQWSRVHRMDDRDAYVRRMIVNAHISWWRRFRRREVPVALVRPAVLRGLGLPRDRRRARLPRGDRPLSRPSRPRRAANHHRAGEQP